MAFSDYDEFDDVQHADDEPRMKGLESSDENGELDDELMRMFGQGKKSSKPRRPRTKAAKPTFRVGDKVIYRRHEATVMFGPYERGSKAMYELRMDDGTVVSAHAQSIKTQ